jgi:dihydrodipicolinate synthase/N-acetylneuraminate lyase
VALEGIAVPAPTMFGADGALDRAANARYARTLSEAGVDHLFFLGTLGEFTVVEDGERRALLETVIESLTGRTDAWVGCGAPSTHRAVRYASEAEEMGAAAILAVPPYYLPPTLPAISAYYRAIRAAVQIPLLAYNIPAKVGYSLLPTMVHQLAADGVLSGIKDTSGNIDSVRGFLDGAPPGFRVFPGDDALAHPSWVLGASGAVMGTGNLVPKLVQGVWRAFRHAAPESAVPLQGLVADLARVMNSGPFPATVKYLAARLRGADVGYRMPYGPLTAEEQQIVNAGLAEIQPRLDPFLKG